MAWREQRLVYKIKIAGREQVEPERDKSRHEKNKYSQTETGIYRLKWHGDSK